MLELNGGNLEAATALERLYQASERYEDLAGVYLTKAQLLDVPDAQREHYFRAGQIYEEILDRPDRAIDVYRKSLQVEPDDVDALDKLQGLLLRLGRWEELLEVYTRKADIVDDPDQKKALYAEVGSVYMPAPQTGSPMTYMLNGRQHIVIAISGQAHQKSHSKK